MKWHVTYHTVVLPSMPGGSCPLGLGFNGATSLLYPMQPVCQENNTSFPFHLDLLLNYTTKNLIEFLLEFKPQES